MDGMWQDDPGFHLWDVATAPPLNAGTDASFTRITYRRELLSYCDRVWVFYVPLDTPSEKAIELLMLGYRRKKTLDESAIIP